MVQPTEDATHLTAPRPIGNSPQILARAYLIGVSLAALVAVVLMPWPQLDTIYVALIAAMAVGELLSVRLRPNAATATLLVVPAIVAYGRLDLAAAPGLLVAVLIATVYRGVLGARLLSTVAREVLSFAVAGVIAGSLADGFTARVVTFSIVLIGVRAMLWQVAQIVRAPTDDRTRPDPL